MGAAISDLQLWDKAPVARLAEDSWLRTQEYYFDQVRAVLRKHGCPLLIAGDIFDRWHASPQLISHAIEWFRGMEVWAIPGNHDMPNHSYTELERSAYWTLVEAGVIHNLFPSGDPAIAEDGPGAASVGAGMMVTPFPYGFDVRPPTNTHSLCINVALIHSYIWTKSTGYEGAPEEATWGSWVSKLKGYDVAIFGDNHKGFITKGKRDHFDTAWPWIGNCGTFIRRHSDERDYKPGIILIHADGNLTRHLLVTDKDRFTSMEETVQGVQSSLSVDLTDFMEELSAAERSERLDFTKAVLHYINHHDSVDQETKTLLLRAIGRK